MATKHIESQHLEAIYKYLEKLPYQARLDYFVLSPAERSLIRAMCSCSPPAGATVWLSIPGLAVRSGLSRKQIQRLLHGYKDPRSGKKHTGLKARGILTEISKASRGHRRPATYRVNWDAFNLDPALIGILENRMQMSLPGIKRPAVPGEEIIPQPATASGDMRHGDACSAETPLVPHVISGRTQFKQSGPLRQPALQMPGPGIPGRDSLSGNPAGKPVEKHLQASGTCVTESQQMRHRDASHASPCRTTCVTVTPIVLDSSSRFSKRSSNRSSSSNEVQKNPPDSRQKADVSKSAWEKLPPNLQKKLTNELKVIRECQVGSHSSYEPRTPEEIAGELRHITLVAAERAGIWPHIAQQIANEWYRERVKEESEKPRYDA
jgi:hypothetical protein